MWKLSARELDDDDDDLIDDDELLMDEDLRKPGLSSLKGDYA